MSYASADWWQASLSPEDKQRDEVIRQYKIIQTANENKIKRDSILEAISPVVKLKSDYLGVSSFYYNEEHNKIYEIDNSNIQLTKPSLGVENHIRSLNNLPMLS